MERFNQFSTLENDFENQNLVMFDVVIHNFGKSYSDISEKMFIFTRCISMWFHVQLDQNILDGI